jgi:hypothetical protein
MFRPQFTGIANQDPAYVTNSAGSHLGVGDGHYHGDMRFDVRIQSTMAGDVNCLQLAKEDRSFDGTFWSIVINKCFSTSGQYWLDNNDSIAGNHFDPSYIYYLLTYWDPPSLVGQYSYVNVVDHFKTYVQFRPGTANGQNIFVTLGTIEWNWEGHSQRISNVWQLVGNNFVSGVTSYQSEDFPIWINIVDNNAPYGSCN